MNKVIKLGLIIGLICNSFLCVNAEESVATKTAEPVSQEENRHKVSIEVPGKETTNEFVVMLDASESVTTHNWENTKHIIQSIANKVLGQTSHKNVLTLMTFGIGPHTAYRIESLEEFNQISLETEEMLFGNSATNCEAAILHIQDYISEMERTSREPKVIFITDGETNMSEEKVVWQNWIDNKSWHASSISSQNVVKSVFTSFGFIDLILNEKTQDPALAFIGYTKASVLKNAITLEVIDNRIASLNITQTNEEIDTLSEAVVSKQSEINVLNEEKVAIEALLLSKKNEFDTQQNEITQLEDDLNKKMAILSQYNEELIVLQNNLNEKQKVLDGLNDQLSVYESLRNRIGELFDDTNLSDAESEIVYELVENHLLTDLDVEVEGIELRTNTMAIYPKWHLFIDRLWYEVYKNSNLTYDDVTGHSISDIQDAFIAYDMKYYNTSRKAEDLKATWYLYYAIHKYSYEDAGHKGPRASIALTQLDTMADVNVIRFRSRRSNESQNWLDPINGKVPETINYYNVKNFDEIATSIDDIMKDIDILPMNHVSVSDYMSKWVILDSQSIKIYDDKTDMLLYDASQGGWQIEESLRPTSSQEPVMIEKVTQEDYVNGGEDVIGNSHEDIYRLIWTVKDGALLASDLYRLDYEVVIDTNEEGFEYDTLYPTNGLTTITYFDENNQKKEEIIEVPCVKAVEKVEEIPEQQPEEKPNDSTQQQPTNPTPEDEPTISDKTPTTPEQEAKPDKEIVESVKTGDTAKIIQFGFIVAVSGVGLAYLQKKRKQKEIDEN